MKRELRCTPRTCSWCAPSAGPGHAWAPDARRRPQGPDLPQVRGSSRQMSRVKERYVREVVPALMKEFGYTNVMAVPRITKVVINMGLGEATQNVKIVDTARTNWGASPARRPSSRARASPSRSSRCARACRSARWSRCGACGCGVPGSADLHRPPARARLQGGFAEGVRRPRQLHAGLKDQLLFQEIDYMKVDKARGMNVSVCTTPRPTRRPGGCCS